MPTYVYKCQDCGFQKEEYLTISHRDNYQECPQCKHEMTRLVGAGTSFYLKGKGFYKQGWHIGGNND